MGAVNPLWSDACAFCERKRDRMEVKELSRFLREYDGPELNIMEVCGSHTAAIAKNGIPGMLSSKIHLISGPGCPVCVTASSYVDRLIELALEEDDVIVTFGDLLRVPGSEMSLSQAKGKGARVEMVYSPMDILKLAQESPDKSFIFAALGFETTTPVYALLMEEILENKIENIRLLTALKCMPPIIERLLQQGARVDGFLAPGHVCAVTGSEIFESLAEKYGLPFVVSGFQGIEILQSLYGLVKLQGKGVVKNFYPSVVNQKGNVQARCLIEKYFEPCDATWRGMGLVKDSGLCLKKEYEAYDAGSRQLLNDKKHNQACQCEQILMGKKKPYDCKLFRKVCNPLHPQGACMVSEEGSCHAYFLSAI